MGIHPTAPHSTGTPYPILERSLTPMPGTCYSSPCCAYVTGTHPYGSTGAPGYCYSSATCPSAGRLNPSCAAYSNCQFCMPVGNGGAADGYYTDNLCTVKCTPVPELSSAPYVYYGFYLILLCVLIYIWRDVELGES